MAGSITPRGKSRYLVRIYLGEDPKTHKRRYASRIVHGSKKEAEQVLVKMLRERDTNTLAVTSGYTVDQYLDHWLETAAKPKLRANTFANYEYKLRVYVRPYIGAKKLEKLTPMDIQAVIGKLTGRGLSARTIRYAHTVLSSALKQAVKWQLLPSNPAKFVDLPKQEKKEMLAMTPEEVKRFLDAALLNEHGLVFVFGLATGMRPSEVMGLQWKDVDLKAGAISVQRGLTRGKAGRHLNPPKTARSRRTIPLPESLVPLLRSHKAAQAERRFKAGTLYDNQDFVFANPFGKPLCDRTLATHFKRVLGFARLPTSLRWYDLRHTMATLLLVANEHPKIVSERLGHSNVMLTLDTYSHVIPGMQRGATEKLEGLMFGDNGEGEERSAH